MHKAKRKSVFITSDVRQALAIAENIGRKDLRIVPTYWLDTRGWRKNVGMNFVIDDGVQLTGRQKSWLHVNQIHYGGSVQL